MAWLSIIEALHLWQNGASVISPSAISRAEHEGRSYDKRPQNNQRAVDIGIAPRCVVVLGVHIPHLCFGSPVRVEASRRTLALHLGDVWTGEFWSNRNGFDAATVAKGPEAMLPEPNAIITIIVVNNLIDLDIPGFDVPADDAQFQSHFITLVKSAPTAALITQTGHWLITLAVGAVIETGGLREVTQLFTRSYWASSIRATSLAPKTSITQSRE